MVSDQREPKQNVLLKMSTTLFIIFKTLGSTATFIDEQSREEALSSYHPNEYKTLQDTKDLDLSAYTRLAMRIFNLIPKQKIGEIAQNTQRSSKKSTQTPPLCATSVGEKWHPIVLDSWQGGDARCEGLE